MKTIVRVVAGILFLQLGIIFSIHAKTNCKADWNCLENKFKKCEPALLTEGGLVVEVLKPAEKGCFVQFEMKPSPLPELEGKKVTCQLQSLDEKSEDWKKCQGRFWETMEGAQK